LKAAFEAEEAKFKREQEDWEEKQDAYRRKEEEKTRRLNKEKNDDEVREAEEEVAYFERNLATLQKQITYFENAIANTDPENTDELEFNERKLIKIYEKFEMDQANFDTVDQALSDLRFEQFNREMSEVEQQIKDAEFDEQRLLKMKQRYTDDIAAVTAKGDSATQ